MAKDVNACPTVRSRINMLNVYFTKLASLECPTVVMHVLLHVKITPDIDLDSISCMYLGEIKQKNFKMKCHGSLIFGSVYTVKNCVKQTLKNRQNRDLNDKW